MQRFAIKPYVYHGPEAISQLKSLNGEKVLIVTDPFMKSTGMIERVTRSLFHIQEKEIYTDIQPDPDIKLISRGVKHILAYQPDIVIACGGGSTIDATKSILYFAREEKAYKDALFVAIPTTSGTGSEVTNFTVMTSENKKIPLVDDLLLPDVVVIDAAFTRTVPSHITANTGMDVLTHALEAYVGNQASYYSDALAEKAIEMVFYHLPRVVANGNDLKSREAMHDASCIAGMAFTNAGLGINHSLAHILGGRYHIPHGQANALFLPHVMAYNAQHSKKARERYGDLSRRLGFQIEGQDNTEVMIAAVRVLKDKIGLPSVLSDTEVDKEAYLKEIPAMAEIAMQDACTANNPFKPRIQDLENIFKKII